MGSEPSTSQGKIKVDEHYPSERDDPDPYDIKRIESIRSDVKIESCYEIAKHIGDGKFGKVFQVKEKTTGREFAAKFIKIRKEADRQEVEREVSILTQLRHPRIAQIYDAFYTTNSEVVLIMEIVRGGELFDRVADENYVLTEQAVAMIICQLCEAIEYIHQQNILHLDIKPENIMCISQTGNRIKLIDFGLARYYDGTQELKYMAGTPEFAAPEVIKFEKLDYHTDMWSVGVITYILLSGYSPFLGDNLGETYCNVEKGVWEFTEEFDTVTDHAKDFITKLLVYERKKRMLPADCLAHPWIAQHRAKSQCDSMLEKPGEGPKIDNKMMMRYNAKRKFRRMVIYVKFLIEMNRLRSSLRERMSEHGQKFFDPLLKMAEEKEKRVALICPKISKPASDSSKKTGEKKTEKKCDSKPLTKLPDIVVSTSIPSTTVKNSETIPSNSSKKITAGELNTSKEDKPKKRVSKKGVTDKGQKESTSQLVPSPKRPKSNSADISKAAETIISTLEKRKEKRTSSPATPSSLFVEKLSGSVSDTALDQTEKMSRMKTSLKKAPSNDVLLNETSPKSTTDIPHIVVTPQKETIGKSEKRAKKTESTDSTKENRSAEVKSPNRQGALRKKERKTDNMNLVLDSRHSVGELPTAQSSCKSEKLGGKAKEPKELKSSSTAAGDIEKRDSLAEVSKSSTPRAGSLVQARLMKIKTDCAPLDVKVVSVPKVKREEIKPLQTESSDSPKKSSLLTLTTEKKTTTTTATTTSVRRKSSTTEKKVNHSSGGNSVEQLERKSSQQNNVKVSQVTMHKEESPEHSKPKTSIKKNVIKQNSLKSTTEKHRKEEETGKERKMIKTTKSVQDKNSESIQLEEKIKSSTGVRKQLSVTGTTDITRKVEGKTESECSPRKTSLKKANLTLTEKVKHILEVKDGAKKNSAEKICTTTVKVSPDDNKRSSTSHSSEDKTACGLQTPSRSSGRDSSEEGKRVRFAGDVDTTSLSSKNSLSPKPSAKKIESEVKVELKTSKQNGEMKKKKKLMLSKSEDVSEYVPREDFSFDNLKEKLLRRVSVVDGECKKPAAKKDLVSIPKTNSVKDRLKQFEKKERVFVQN